MNVNREKIAKFLFDSTVSIATLTILFFLDFPFTFSLSTHSTCLTVSMYFIEYCALKWWHLALIGQQTIKSEVLQLQYVYFNFCSHTMFRILFYSFCNSTHCSTVWTRSSGQYFLVRWFFIRWPKEILTFDGPKKIKYRVLWKDLNEINNNFQSIPNRDGRQPPAVQKTRKTILFSLKTDRVLESVFYWCFSVLLIYTLCMSQSSHTLLPLNFGISKCV